MGQWWHQCHAHNKDLSADMDAPRLRRLCGCGGFADAEPMRMRRCGASAGAEVRRCGGPAEAEVLRMRRYCACGGAAMRRSCGACGGSARAEVVRRRSLCGCGHEEPLRMRRCGGPKLLRRRRCSACRCVVRADVQRCGACVELAEGPHMRRLCTCGACADAEVRSLCGCGGAEVSRRREENKVRGMDLGFCDEVECTVGVLASLEFV